MFVNLFVKKVTVMTKILIYINCYSTTISKSRKNKEIIILEMINNALSSHKHFINIPITKKEIAVLMTIPVKTVFMKDIMANGGEKVIHSELGKIIGYSKNITRFAGVYIWTNLVTKEQYVGSSVDIARRVRTYLNSRGLKANRIVNVNMKSYGIANYSLSVCIINPVTIRSADKIFNDHFNLGRMVVALEQYFIIQYKPVLNTIKVAGGGWPTPLPITESQRVAMSARNNIPCYVYIDNILIAQAESALQLSKITGASTSGIARSIKKGSSLYNKFTISRLSPTFTSFQNLLDEKDL